MKEITKIRKEVAVIANRINRKIRDLSSAFKRAWQIVKGRLLISKIAGVTFGNRQTALSHLTKYPPETVTVALRREADNQHDANAVAVDVSVNNSRAVSLGYIPREWAELIAPIIDAGVALTAVFKEVTGGIGHKLNYGALVEIQLCEQPPEQPEKQTIKYSVSEITRRAWAIRRETGAGMASALREAWRAVKLETAKAPVMAKLDELEEREFYLNMKDRWSAEDHFTASRLTNEIWRLKDQLTALETSVA
jgi:hypothetical protein